MDFKKLAKEAHKKHTSEGLRKFYSNYENRKTKSDQSKKLWQDYDYVNKIKQSWDDNKRAKASTDGKRAWTDAYRQKMRELWQNPIYRNKMSISRKWDMAMYEASRHLWADSEFRSSMELIWHNKSYKTLLSDRSKKFWIENRQKMLELFHSDKYLDAFMSAVTSQEYRQKISRAVKKNWENQEFAKRMIELRNKPELRQKMAIARLNQPRVSSIQTILYSILDDLGIKYYREYLDRPSDLECAIGPYVFDCVIPREGKPTLLIECQGDYWHSIDKKIKQDQSKATYINNNLSNQYELKCIWEHEFQCKDRVVELIKYWMGIAKLELIDFDFNNVKIKECPASDYRLLLSKYHYLANACRGGITYGAYLDNELIAVCGFSPLIRQNIPEDSKTTRELSRLCIHPRYQKRNFASWFVSRCIKLLPNQYTTIISYTDTTFNHNGTVYKALNFKLDSEIKPDYWYVDKDGWVMHKKSLYDHARKMNMIEKDFAEKNGYKKIHGNKKLKFVFKRI